MKDPGLVMTEVTDFNTEIKPENSEGSNKAPAEPADNPENDKNAEKVMKEKSTTNPTKRKYCASFYRT